MAYWLRDRGFEAYAVQGGVLAFLGRPPRERTSQPERHRLRQALAALRHKRYRRFSVGVLLSQTGGWIQMTAFGYVVLLLGGSVATLALIGFLLTLPALVWSLPAGAFADRFDQRKLLLWLQAGSMVVPAILAVLWATRSLTVGIMGLAAIIDATLSTLSFPAFHGMIASTVPRRDLESAVAINSLILQVARFLGPVIAGVVLATAGPTWVFAANAASFLAVLAAIALLPAPRARARRIADQIGGGMKAGFRFLLASRSIASLLVLTMLAGLFAVPPIGFMLPAIVRFRLHAGPGTLGALTAALGLGSLAGAVLLVALSRRTNKGEPAILSYLLLALAIVVVALTKSVGLWVALVVAGLARTLFQALSTVVVQAASADEIRARAMAIWAVAFTGAVPVGALITAGLAGWLGVGGAVLTDGLALLVGGALILSLRPEVRWLGCTTLPQTCIAGIDPAAVALETEADEASECRARVPA